LCFSNHPDVPCINLNINQKMPLKQLLPILSFISLTLASCGFDGDQWEHDIPGIGASSSPVATDLNGDGVKDIIIGGGAKEFTPTETAVVAIDGATGERLWSVPGHNQMVGSAILKDITGDGTEDVFIGGRSGMFFAIDGRSGQKLWEYIRYDPNKNYVDDTTILNFFNPQWIPDMNGDRMEDIIAPYGGFVKAQAGDPNRPAGYLIILDGKNGNTLAKARVPDGKETYMSPLVHDFGNGLEVIFGTGGEDIPGSLYRANIGYVLQENLEGAVPILSGGEKGMIAPPLLADVTQDGIPDIVISTVDGRVVCLNGKTNETVWSTGPEGDFDTYVMPAPGFFTGDDDVPDFFASFGHGAWPTTEFTLHTLIDGKTGKIVFSDTLGTFQYASPVVADFTKDGVHDVMLAINTRSTHDVLGDPTEFLNNGLYVYSSGRGAPGQAFPPIRGSNLGSTPLLTDLDGDGKLDIITAYMDDPRNFYSFKNLKISRREIDRDASGIFFGQYMGPGSRGKTPRKK
jgi:outer membrane protein assembly factor BamB